LKAVSKSELCDVHGQLEAFEVINAGHDHLGEAGLSGRTSQAAHTSFVIRQLIFFEAFQGMAL
jgi:hypothetical protein